LPIGDWKGKLKLMHVLNGERLKARSGDPRLVPLPEAETRAFITSRYHEPAVHFLWHYHHEVELVWIRAGSGLRYVGSSIKRFGPGDLVLLGGGLPHTWASDIGQPSDAIWSVIQFHPRHWSEGFWKLPELGPVNDLLLRSAGGVQFTGPLAPRVGKQIEELAAMPAYSLEGLVLFLKIFGQLARMPSRTLNDPRLEKGPGRSDPRLELLLQWIQGQISGSITQAQAAGEVKMGPAAFSRWFKASVGRVFQRHVNELRVAKVCALLAGGEKSITEAAFKCGYNNLANFNRRFRELTGMTPSMFRNQTRLRQEESARKALICMGAHGAVRIAGMRKPKWEGGGRTAGKTAKG
jgi:AraC-like DNA-binding protein/mannose-6-phosphate isomerase-like protein (cupin superfamily)